MNAPVTPSQGDALHKAERQQQVVAALKAVLPAHALLWNNEDTTPYECDGLTAYRQRPLVVALPENRARLLRVATCRMTRNRRFRSFAQPLPASSTSRHWPSAAISSISTSWKSLRGQGRGSSTMMRDTW